MASYHSYNDFTGFDEFSDLLEKYLKNTSKENVLNVLEIGAETVANDVRALPRPRSRRSGGGWTHLLDTITYEKNGEEIEVGWGKYYGMFLEKGTCKMSAQPHIAPTFERNKEKYYEKMKKALFE